MKHKLKQLLLGLPNEASPRIIIKQENSEPLTPSQVAELRVQDLERYHIELFGSPLVTTETPRGYIGLFRGGIKATPFLPGHLEAHHYLTEAHKTAEKITGRANSALFF